jgi:hypothetical protein
MALDEREEVKEMTEELDDTASGRLDDRRMQARSLIRLPSTTLMR